MLHSLPHAHAWLQRSGSCHATRKRMDQRAGIQGLLACRACRACVRATMRHARALPVAQCRCVPACMHPHTACTPRPHAPPMRHPCAPMHHPSVTTARSPMACTQPHAACPPLHHSSLNTVPTAHVRAAPRTMPPLRQQNLKKLVRKLGASSRPGEQAQALAVISEACRDDPDLHFRAAIVAVGAIPLLVPLLGPGSPAEVQQGATFILWCVSLISENVVVTIADAGAIPLLLQLLKPGSPADVQDNASRALANLAAIEDHAVTIASAGAIPLLVQMMAPSSPVMVQVASVRAIYTLARHAGNAASIAVSGAIPLLVQFLDSGDGHQL
jgi:hypothetical protein